MWRTGQELAEGTGITFCAGSAWCLQGRPDPAAGVPPAVKGKLTRELRKRMQDSKARSSAMLPPVALHGGRGKTLAASFRPTKGARKGKAGSSEAWLDTSAAQADPDMPMPVEGQNDGPGYQCHCQKDLTAGGVSVALLSCHVCLQLCKGREVERDTSSWLALDSSVLSCRGGHAASRRGRRGGWGG